MENFEQKQYIVKYNSIIISKNILYILTMGNFILFFLDTAFNVYIHRKKLKSILQLENYKKLGVFTEERYYFDIFQILIIVYILSNIFVTYNIKFVDENVEYGPQELDFFKNTSLTLKFKIIFLIQLFSIFKLLYINLYNVLLNKNDYFLKLEKVDKSNQKVIELNRESFRIFNYFSNFPPVNRKIVINQE